MISVNPVNFESIDKMYRYAVNPQFLRSWVGPKQPLHLRRQCLLKPTSVMTNTIPGKSHITFTCVSPDHKHRFCSVLGSAIEITRLVFETNTQSTGNVLVKLHTGRCHSCGMNSNRCWAEYTGHLVCSGCVGRGDSSAPYPYGKLEKKCCVANGCGSALKWFSETDQDLLQRAIAIYERHTV
jgi:hypothetical protein